MAQFTAEVFQNEFLPQGGTDVHAIVTVTCSGAGEAGRGEGGDAAEIIIIDTSGSMQGDAVRGGTAGRRGGASTRSSTAPGSPSSPAPTRPPAPSRTPTPCRRWCGWNRGARAEAKRAVRQLLAGGGTAMGTWLRAGARRPSRRCRR